MPTFRLLPLLAVLLLATAGCGTMANLEGRRFAFLDLPQQEAPTPFGGVGRDFRWMCSSPVGLIFIADVPFSLVGDIVTLPEVIRMNREGYHLWGEPSLTLKEEPEDALSTPPDPTPPAGSPGG